MRAVLLVVTMYALAAVACASALINNLPNLG